MNKTLKALLITASVFATSIAIAAPAMTLEKECFPPITRVSKNSSDVVTIQNGGGAYLMIVITVSNSETANSAGLNIKNCGSTSHIDAGSSAVCSTNDSANPVTFNSDSQSFPANVTYQIKQL